MEIKQAAQALQVVFDKAVDSGIISRSAVEQGGKSALSAMDVISKARIPILSTDKDVIDFCRQYRLNEPQNIIRFFVESYYAQFSASVESIIDLQRENLDDVISRVDNARNYLLDALKQSNESSRRELLRDSVRESRSAISNLQRKIENYISEIRRIDDLPDWKYKLQAPMNSRKLKAQGALAKAAASSLCQAINLLESASAELGETANAVFEGYKQFMQDTVIPNARLMHDYDENKRQEYWLSMRKQLEANTILADVMEDISSDSIDIDEFDNIDFG